jgi:MioC protein
MSEAIKILVGTMTGTAEMVAEAISDKLEAQGHEVETILMDGQGADVFAPGLYLIVTSTYGQGDVPDNAQALFADLEEKKPDLSGVSYGLFGLGDMTYRETFNFGGRRFDTLLSELGATRIGERFEHDASSGTLAEDEAEDWAEGWAENLSEVRDAA